MKILLTGGSSLTGYWFAKELKKQGHEVHCTLTRENIEAYGNEKNAQRARLLGSEFEISFGVEFGTRKFCDLLNQGNYDIVCLHGAHIPDYKSPEFNIADSLFRNLFNIHEVFTILADRPTPFVLTGTIFEPGEGDGGKPTEAVSPYGFAKSLIAKTFQFYSKKFGVPMAKFIIPNPIGPLEDKKFTAYLIDCWKKGQVAHVKTPLYIRDNIHVQLLAMAYADLVVARAKDRRGDILITRPSGYCESQGEFTTRFAQEMGPRLGISCKFELIQQTEFLEPKIRLNSEPAQNLHPEFSEKQAWDELAEFYR